MQFFQFLTLNFQIFEIIPQKMLILTILSQKTAIFDNFPLLKEKDIGKLSLFFETFPNGGDEAFDSLGWPQKVGQLIRI